MRRTTQTQQPTLFEQILLNADKDEEDQEKQTKVSKVNQSKQSTTLTKSLHNQVFNIINLQQNIFYQNNMDYKEYKQSLRYNSKILKKIEIINIDNPNAKIIRNLTKYPLSSLQELILETVDVTDTQFQIFQQKGGLSKCFQNLVQVKLNCPSMTTLSIDYLFQGIQSIQNLDLSYTKIDNQGIYNLCQLKWPFLNTFVLQWCNNVDNLDEIGENAENFPSLRNIDSRFTQTENEAYNSIFNSKISVTLNLVRLYGTLVDLDTTQWKSIYLLNLFMNTMKDYKFQEFRIQNDPACVQSSSDYKQMKNTLIVITTEQKKVHLNISWKITPLQGLLQFVETAENVRRKFANFGKLFEFLQKQWYNLLFFFHYNLESLCKLFLFVLIQYNVIQTTLILFQKPLLTLRNLKNLNFMQGIKFFQTPQVTSFILIKLANSNNLCTGRMNVQLYSSQFISQQLYFFFVFYFRNVVKQYSTVSSNLQNNGIVINESFLNRIIRSIQQLSYLNLFYLNIRFNEIQNIKDLHNFNSQIINSIKNPYLNHIYLMETREENLNYRFKQALSLFHSNASKFININEFENIIIQQDAQNFKEKIFKQSTELFYKKKMKLIRSCVLSNCHQLNYGNRFRQQVIYQILDMIINS